MIKYKNKKKLTLELLLLPTIDVDRIDGLRYLLVLDGEITSCSLRSLTSKSSLLPCVDVEIVIDVDAIDVLRWYLLDIGGEAISHSSRSLKSLMFCVDGEVVVDVDEIDVLR